MQLETYAQSLTYYVLLNPQTKEYFRDLLGDIKPRGIGSLGMAYIFKNAFDARVASRKYTNFSEVRRIKIVDIGEAKDTDI